MSDAKSDLTVFYWFYPIVQRHCCWGHIITERTPLLTHLNIDALTDDEIIELCQKAPKLDVHSAVPGLGPLPFYILTRIS
ncbi:hypothetical protein AcV7_002103 [Taiwanofungus camphoratus]|nr:hypothetical protein AcV7_002103 [Antrodia cinnamomea]